MGYTPRVWSSSILAGHDSGVSPPNVTGLVDQILCMDVAACGSSGCPIRHHTVCCFKVKHSLSLNLELSVPGQVSRLLEVDSTRSLSPGYYQLRV